MNINIITIFPEMFGSIFSTSILKIAQKKQLLKIKIHNLRNFTEDKHRKVDSTPYGGGPGMVFKCEPIFKAVEAIGKGVKGKGKRAKVILLSPKGKTLDQKLVKVLVKNKQLTLICGHYEGVDERIRKSLVDEEISIGDYVLSGGELAAMGLVDSLARLIPGVVGDYESVKQESFEKDLLDYPYYTRPQVYRGQKVPSVLLSGNHKKIEEWRRKQAIKITKKRRPDLIKRSLALRARD